MTYPIKYVILVALCAPLLAAFVLAQQQNLRNEEKLAFGKRLVLVGTILLALIAGILFWAWRYPFPPDDVPATLRNGLSRAFFLLLTGALLLVLMRASKPGLRRIAPLILVVVAWLDVFKHEPPQNPTVPPSVYGLNLARIKLAMNPQPELGCSRAMITTKEFMEFIHFASSDPKNNFLGKRLGFCGNVNLLDAVPKVDGFFSLTPRESDDLNSLLYGTTTNFRDWKISWASRKSPRRTNFSIGSRARTFLPLVTAGQKPVFLDDPGTLRALTQPDFDGGKMVFLPPEAKSLVTVTNQTATRLLEFTIQSATSGH